MTHYYVKNRNGGWESFSDLAVAVERLEREIGEEKFNEILKYLDWYNKDPWNHTYITGIGPSGCLWAGNEVVFRMEVA